MDKGPLHDRIVEAYDGLSAQLQAAARFVLERPRDVALLSMREQARQAGLQPATMTRFAQHLGLDGYDAVRALHADAMRGSGAGGLGTTAAGQQGTNEPGAAKGATSAPRPPLKGDRALAASMLGSLAGQMQGLATADGLDSLAAAGKALAKARRIYVLGLRACYPAAWHLHQALRATGRKAQLLDGPGDTGADLLAAADREDVLVAIGVAPQVRRTLDMAAAAAERGVPIVAITDGAVSPLARLARHTVLVATESPALLPAMAPVLAVTEILAAIVGDRGGDKAAAALRRSAAHHAALGTYEAPRAGRKPAASVQPAHEAEPSS